MESSPEISSFIGNAEEFPIVGGRVFLNHAAVAPLCRRAAMAVVKYAGHAAENAYLESDWYKQIEQLRTSAANLINGSADEIALVKNTSEGLAIVAGGIDWREGDRIVTTAVEYPANAYPWIDLQQRKGIDLVRVEEVDTQGTRRVPIDAILGAAGHPRTRLVTLSHVEYGTGQRHDLAAIGKFCRDRNIRLCVDAIQSLGVIPVDVRHMNIDFLSADGHKWLLGPEGAGVFYCRKELIERIHPPLVGWMNVRHFHDFDTIRYELRSDAGRFECGSHNVPGMLGLKASMDLLVGVGIGAIWKRVEELTDTLVAGLREQGWTVASPRDKGEASGIVSFSREGVNPQTVLRKLRQSRIELAVRAGRLRCSPHFYNTDEEIARVVEELHSFS